jgi:diaminopropionate ammonia-lyase
MNSFDLFLNPHHGLPGMVVLPEGGFRRARAAIAGWPGYAPTPLHDLPARAAALGLAALRVKDEAPRFGLGSFKALGGAHAVALQLAAEQARSGRQPADLVVTCASDGNHGRAVAWGAERCGAGCVIFLHPGVSAARAAAIARHGAEVRRVPGHYDDAVRAAAEAAEREAMLLIADTAWPGYTEVPRAVMQGYRLMPAEALEQWGALDAAPPTHVFIQAGVGGVAAAVSVQLRASVAAPPRLIVVEPRAAAGLLASARAGCLTAADGTLETVMGCLACGEPSLLAWQELERAAFAFLAIDDAAAIEAMRWLADDGIVAGESGGAGLAGLLSLAADPSACGALGLDRTSRVLLFSTEGVISTEPHPCALVRTPGGG